MFECQRNHNAEADYYAECDGAAQMHNSWPAIPPLTCLRVAVFIRRMFPLEHVEVILTFHMNLGVAVRKAICFGPFHVRIVTRRDLPCFFLAKRNYVLGRF